MSTTTYAPPEPSAADLMADRPLGPVFESRFCVGTVRVHVSVVRGSVELLDLARDRAEELLGLWVETSADSILEAATTSPETFLLVSLARAEARGPAAYERLDVVAQGLAADLLVRELLDEGALGAAVRVGDDAAFGGLPPRVEGWRVQVPGPADQPQLLMVDQGGVSTRGEGRSLVTVTSDHAWRAADQADRQARTGQATGVTSASRSAPE